MGRIGRKEKRNGTKMEGKEETGKGRENGALVVKMINVPDE